MRHLLHLSNELIPKLPYLRPDNNVDLPRTNKIGCCTTMTIHNRLVVACENSQLVMTKLRSPYERVIVVHLTKKATEAKNCNS